MNNKIILISGPLAVGKTAVASILDQDFGYTKISSSKYLRLIAEERGLADSRSMLQDLGDLLDEETNFSWLVNDVASNQLASNPYKLNWFVDAVRKPQQVQLFRKKFPLVFHVHLTAPDEILEARFLCRAREGDNVDHIGSYKAAIAHPNEQAARGLCHIADEVIDLSACTPDKAALTIVRF